MRPLGTAWALCALLVLPAGAATTANKAPRLSNVKASIGTVYDEAAAKPRKNGLKLSFRVCDDGPPASAKRYGLINITFRWRDRLSESYLTVEEQGEMITWEVYFHKPECVSNIPEDDPLPAFLPYVGGYPCFSVTVKVRDPGGLWSNAVTQVVRKCK